MAHDAWMGRPRPRTPGRDVRFDHVRAVAALAPRPRFEGLIERHEARLRRLAYGMLTDSHRVDDVLQEAFIRAYRKMPNRFESERQEAAWLYRIVYRCCLNELRSVRRRRDVPSDLANHAVDGPELSESAWIAGALAELPTDQRAVVLLVDLLGFDYEGAASVLHAPRGTIAWRLNAARGRLRELLSEEDEGA